MIPLGILGNKTFPRVTFPPGTHGDGLVALLEHSGVLGWDRNLLPAWYT